MSFRIGLGYDVHQFGTSGRLVLGGVTIDWPALAAHSDGDVVSHALADALLGAAGLPDLGTLFPASDDRYRGVSSIGFLLEIANRLSNEGWHVVNIDVVVAAEEPPLSTHLDAMQANLAAALDEARGPDDDHVSVSVKPKRGEGLGAVGRGEGIAVWAVALLERH